MASAMSGALDYAPRGVSQVALLPFFLLIVVLLGSRVFLGWQRNPFRLPLPPGPRGYPVIGNLLEMPVERQWLKYVEWGKVHGDIFSLKVLGRRIIVLNSLEAAQDLLEKRSANYSDRTRLPMLMELMNSTFNVGFLPYGQWWRRHRRILNQHLRASIMQKYEPIQLRRTRVLLARLLHSPQDFASHLRENLASTIMSMTYGIQITGFDDPYVRNIEESLEGLNAAAVPGAFLVDLMPILKHVPSWFPGAGFKRKAARWATVNQDVVHLPFDHVIREMDAGIAIPSIAATLVAALQAEADPARRAEDLTIAKNVTAITYEAGADTTISAIQTAFLAMALYPEIQEKAQVELDAIIGPGRVPELSDRPSLPYINAILKETLRWQPVVPLAVPHVATNDDIYRGFFIPKGTLVIGNAWAMMQDENIFQNPQDFQPERYLKDGRLDFSVRQPEVSVFGFGRRICPGRHFADTTMFLVIASTLHAFNITPGLNERGEPESLAPKMTAGLISYPEPFKIGIQPRNATTEALIRHAALVET